MRIEYWSHVILPKGTVLISVLEWEGDATLPESRKYSFLPRVGRWMDEGANVILNTDPRHLRLLELMAARSVEAELNELIDG